MKIRVKNKVVKELTFDLQETDDMIFRMYGSQWFSDPLEESSGSHVTNSHEIQHEHIAKPNCEEETQISKDQYPPSASQHDLDPYEIENVPDDYAWDSSGLLRPRLGASSVDQIPYSRGMSLGTVSSRGSASRGRASRGRASSGRASRGRASRGRASRGPASRGRQTQQREVNFAGVHQVRRVR